MLKKIVFTSKGLFISSLSDITIYESIKESDSN